MSVVAILLLAALLAAGAVVAALRRRLELVALAAHELRGPATVLLMALERIARDPAARRHADVLGIELARLRTALADLDAARAGRRAAPAPEPVDLERMAQGALAGWREELARAGRPVTVRWGPRPGHTVADPGRLAQVLANLVSNAARHGDGPVRVRGAGTGKTVRIEIENAAAGPRGRPGHGLSVTRSAVREAGGALRVERSSATVRARLDLPAAPAGRAGERAPEASPPAGPAG